MALLQILAYPDPRLRKIAAPVAAVTPEIQRLIRDMAETMYAAPGIGLAATQVDVHKRIIVIDTSETRDDLRVFVNPEIIATEGEAECEEGCLSVPGYYDCVQHETEHLEGRIFVDHLSALKRQRLAARLRKRQRLAG
jgi:peptide deformylase